MSEPTPGQHPFTQADLEFAANLFNQGETAETVQAKLVERGMPPEAANALLYKLLMQTVYTDAINLLNAGHGPQQVKQKLVEKGVREQTACAVVDDIVAQNRTATSQAGGGKPLLQFLGTIVFVIGIGLLIGNITRIFPTFPFAGFIVMFIGGAIWRAGKGE